MDKDLAVLKAKLKDVQQSLRKTRLLFEKWDNIDDMHECDRLEAQEQILQELLNTWPSMD